MYVVKGFLMKLSTMKPKNVVKFVALTFLAPILPSIAANYLYANLGITVPIIIFLSLSLIICTCYVIVMSLKNKSLIKLPGGFIIYISGTNGVGKSTIARELAKALDIDSIIPVDDLREVLRSQECLYENAGRVDDYEILKESSYKTIDYLKQCELMAKPISYLANRKKKYIKSAIIEGINILPSKINTYEIANSYVLFVNLEVENFRVLKKRLEAKVNDVDKKQTYMDHKKKIQEIEEIIRDDFKNESSRSSSYNTGKIHTVTITNEEINKTVDEILGEIRKILEL